MSLEASFNSLMDRFGHDVELVRLPDVALSLKAARAPANKEDKLVHEVSQEAVLMKIRSMDLHGSVFESVPPKKLDRIREAGEYLTIEHSAPMYIGNKIVGYNIWVVGGHA